MHFDTSIFVCLAVLDRSKNAVGRFLVCCCVLYLYTIPSMSQSMMSQCLSNSAVRNHVSFYKLVDYVSLAFVIVLLDYIHVRPCVVLTQRERERERALNLHSLGEVADL